MQQSGMRTVGSERVCLGNETEGIGDGVVARVSVSFSRGGPEASDKCWIGE